MYQVGLSCHLQVRER